MAPIGAGGMGEVYRATDSNLKRSVAIKVLPASVAGDADRLARFHELAGQISTGPAGGSLRLAYASNDSGRFEIYVQPYPGGANRVPVSNAGGTWPTWSRDGNELFYVTGDALVAAAMRPDGSFGPPRRLFDRSNVLFTYRFRTYDVSPDGKRFLMIHRDKASVPRQLNVILNWREEPTR